MEVSAAVDASSVEEILRAFGQVGEELACVLTPLRDLLADFLNDGAGGWRSAPAETHARWASWLTDQALIACVGGQAEPAPAWLLSPRAVAALNTLRSAALAMKSHRAEGRPS